MPARKTISDREELFEQIYWVVKQIPPGRVSTYGAIAHYLGIPNGARVVGIALNRIRSEIHQIPAHRVVNRLGYLTGKNHFPTPHYMANQLRKEGIPVENDRIIHFSQYFWDPAKELQ